MTIHWDDHLTFHTDDNRIWATPKNRNDHEEEREMDHQFRQSATLDDTQGRQVWAGEASRQFELLMNKNEKLKSRVAVLEELLSNIAIAHWEDNGLVAAVREVLGND